MSSVLVALAVGNGTGPELAGVFEQVIQALAAPYDVAVNFLRSSRTYHSYSSLLAINDTDAVTQETLKDAAHYRRFCSEAVSLGACAIFRTSISAQALYMVREQLQAVKVEHFAISSSTSILLVRDQAQGFYSGYNKASSGNDSVSRTVHFSKAVFERILSFALTRARHVWGSRTTIKTVTMVYKFHLFDGLFHSWAQEWGKGYGVSIELVQGDTMNRNLLASGVKGHQLVISANEYADIMETILLDRFGLGPQEAACAENVYLHPEVHGLSEYQTAHGSADDLTGKGIVNPVATIRAAAVLLEEHVGCHGVQNKADRALQVLQSRRIATPDQGGTATTASFLEMFLEASAEDIDLTSGSNGDLSRAWPLRGQSCLVVVDFQNDFIMQHPRPRVMEQVTENISRVVDFVRHCGMEVVFMRFLGDEHFQPPSWRHRNQVQNRRPMCVEGTWGAEISNHVKLQPQERVFDKKAGFDPYLLADFEQYMTRFEHLLVVGLYADICVDATLRGAFQRGLWTTVVRECTTGLHLPDEQIFKYMETVYGSGVITAAQLFSPNFVAY